MDTSNVGTHSTDGFLNIPLESDALGTKRRR